MHQDLLWHWRNTIPRGGISSLKKEQEQGRRAKAEVQILEETLQAGRKDLRNRHWQTDARSPMPKKVLIDRQDDEIR